MAFSAVSAVDLFKQRPLTVSVSPRTPDINQTDNENDKLASWSEVGEALVNDVRSAFSWAVPDLHDMAGATDLTSGDVESPEKESPEKESPKPEASTEKLMWYQAVPSTNTISPRHQLPLTTLTSKISSAELERIRRQVKLQKEAYEESQRICPSPWPHSIYRNSSISSIASNGTTPDTDSPLSQRTENSMSPLRTVATLDSTSSFEKEQSKPWDRYSRMFRCDISEDSITRIPCCFKRGKKVDENVRSSSSTVVPARLPPMPRVYKSREIRDMPRLQRHVESTVSPYAAQSKNASMASGAKQRSLRSPEMALAFVRGEPGSEDLMRAFNSLTAGLLEKKGKLGLRSKTYFVRLHHFVLTYYKNQYSQEVEDNLDFYALTWTVTKSGVMDFVLSVEGGHTAITFRANPLLDYSRDAWVDKIQQVLEASRALRQLYRSKWTCSKLS